ncbi:unnamed protein product, partial [Closterium sp. NIES-53]
MNELGSRVRTLLPCASRPTAACTSRSAAPRVAPCCSPHVAPCCPARRALLQPARRALLLRASRPTAARASRSAAPRVVPCCSPHVAPYCPARRALLQPARRALLPCTARALLPTPPSLSRPPATTAIAAAAAAESAGGAAGAGGIGGAARSTGGAGGAEPTTNQAAALSSSESAAAPGAGESAVALGAHESADTLGASASTATGPASAEALHTFTLDSGASRCFFRDCTTVTPLAAPVLVSLADPIGGPVVARASNFLPCPAVPSGFLSSLHLPAFSTNLLRNAVLQDEWVDTFIPGGQSVAICQVAASSRVSASGQLAASCSCRVLSHQTLLWHHCLGHPLVPHLRSMHSRLHRAAPHSSEFPPTTAPLQTLPMDVWGPLPVGGTDQERYFLLVVDNYTHYTTFFPLRRKADVSGVLIPWIRATCRQLRERFRRDFPVLRQHSNRGVEFSSDLLAEFCRDEGIRHSFTLPASPQQNEIAEHCIGLIME